METTLVGKPHVAIAAGNELYLLAGLTKSSNCACSACLSLIGSAHAERIAYMIRSAWFSGNAAAARLI
jgi:hypothetical protein